MLENQLISKIIDEKELTILTENNLSSKHFLANKDVVRFIEDYSAEYKSIPSKSTILSQFPTFEFIEVEDSVEYLIDGLRENYIYSKTAPALKHGAEKVRTNSIEGLEYLKAEIDRLILEAHETGQVGTDIIKQSRERLEDYQKRVEMEGLMGISSGIKALDDITFGWLPADLITIFARPGEGKSWLLLYLLIQAWLKGNKVLLYSGEMSSMVVGYRMDAFLGHFSNSGLMSGRENLKTESHTYEDYIKELEQMEGFIIVTPSDLKNNYPTTQDIERLIELHKPDIVGIDQIPLMADWQGETDIKAKFGNISQDLYNMSERLKIPILAATQANREASKRNEGKENPEPPKSDDIYGSDKILQDSTRVLALARVDNILKIQVRKNRYGISGPELLMNWNIDQGYIKPLIDDELLVDNKYGF